MEIDTSYRSKKRDRFNEVENEIEEKDFVERSPSQKKSQSSEPKVVDILSMLLNTQTNSR